MRKNPFEVLRRIPIEQFESSGDRSTAIVGAAYLDETLKHAIRSRFAAEISSEVDDRIFKGTGPLANFSAKIDVAYALGLLGKRSRRDLHRIREIRNKFAHTFKSTRFTTQEIADRCAALWLPANIRMKDADSAPSHPREQYRTAIGMIMALIRAEQAESKSVGEKARIAP